MNLCIFKLLEFSIYFHFSSSGEFTWLQKNLILVFMEHNLNLSDLKHPELHFQLPLGLCGALLVLHITHKLLLVLY